MRVAYLGPAGTFSHEALLSGAPGAADGALPVTGVHEAIMAVQDGRADRALVPIENSLEGSVNATLDTLAVEATAVMISGELVHSVRHCLIAREPVELPRIVRVASHPQATAQCARFLRERVPGATVEAAPSTADAVRAVAESREVVGALGNRLSAEIYGCTVLEEGVEDMAGNQTRFVWVAPLGRAAEAAGPWKTSIVFWGPGDTTPGWLVGCLAELADRHVNLTMIESRPRRLVLGHYMFFADLQGRAQDPPVAEALTAVARHTEILRVLGSYPAA